MRARLEATAFTLIVFGALVACNALVGFGTLEKVDAVAGGDGGAGGGGGASSSSASSSSSSSTAATS